MRIALSIVIPAFNEGQRLPRALGPIRAYLDAAFAGDYEVIVVDDGSTDGTVGFLETESAGWQQLSFIRHLVNQGKGAAVRTGMLAAHGDLLLFSDADGATPIGEEAKLREAVSRGADIAIGSRVLRAPGVAQVRHLRRRVVSAGFSLLGRRLVPLPVADTQCGFKMFRADVGRRLFGCVQECGYLFDVELLALAHGCRYRIAEVPVSWMEMQGGKLRLVRDSVQMLAGLLALKRRLPARIKAAASDVAASVASETLVAGVAPSRRSARALERPCRDARNHAS